MDGITKEKFLNLVKQTKEELESDSMQLCIQCSKVGAKMLDGIVDWGMDPSKLDEAPFNIILGNLKDTDVPVFLSKSADTSEYHTLIRLIPKAEFSFERFDYNRIPMEVDLIE